MRSAAIRVKRDSLLKSETIRIKCGSWMKSATVVINNVRYFEEKRTSQRKIVTITAACLNMK